MLSYVGYRMRGWGGGLREDNTGQDRRHLGNRRSNRGSERDTRVGLARIMQDNARL